jgi:O-antigen ligase
MWTFVAIAVGLIVLSKSKSALLIFLTLVALLPLYRALRWNDTLAIPFFITVILGLGSVATWLVGNWENFLYGIGRDPTLNGRTDIWSAVIYKIWQRPWFGYGYQGFWQEKGEADFVWKAIHYKVHHAHNGFINIGVDLGLLGLLFFVLSIVYAYQRGLAWTRLSKTSEDLWPIMYVTFLFMYNHSESTIVEPNSIFWVLHVAVTLSLKSIVVKPEVFEKNQEQEWLAEPAQKSLL